MSRMKWYKRDHQAALSGMLPLSLEERGAYNTILDLIYTTDDRLHDDDRFICGWLRCDLRVWKRLKASLILHEKIVVADGFIRNFRATYEIDDALRRGLSTSELNRSKGIKSGAVRRENKDLGEPRHEPKSNRIKNEIEEVRKDTPLSPPQGGQNVKGQSGNVRRKKRASLRETFFDAVGHIQARPEASGGQGSDEGSREDPVVLPRLRQGYP